MTNAHLYAPELVRLIESCLEPEVCIAACDFVITDTNDAMTAILTNRRMRLTKFESDDLGKKRHIVVYAAYPARTISGISTKEEKQSLSGPMWFHLRFWREGYGEELATETIAEGRAFAEELKETVAWATAHTHAGAAIENKPSAGGDAAICPECHVGLDVNKLDTGMNSCPSCRRDFRVEWIPGKRQG
jgi:hypothetical protein